MKLNQEFEKRIDARKHYLKKMSPVPQNILRVDERDTQDRIASALERIADALEAQSPARGGLINE